MDSCGGWDAVSDGGAVDYCGGLVERRMVDGVVAVVVGAGFSPEASENASSCDCGWERQ